MSDLILFRTIRYAGIQARLKARIGQLPDAQWWSAMAAGSNRDLLTGLEGAGVDFWLEGFGSGASTTAIERHFNGRIRHLLAQVASWLPVDWKAFGDCLTLAPDVFWLVPVLNGAASGENLDKNSNLHSLLRVSLAQRGTRVLETPFSDCLVDGLRPELRWRQVLIERIPDLSRAQHPPMRRLLRAIDDYLDAKTGQFARIARNEGDAQGIDAAGSWKTHAMLERKLRMLLAGDPFQPALILIYAMLELMTMEKLRALLICRSLDWPVPMALAGASRC